METATPKTDIGVIIGRFQVHDLTAGHEDLIDAVCQRHKKVLILMGRTRSVLVTRNNPLDYQTRMLMIRDAYPDIMVMPLLDMPVDDDWSRSVDQRIRDAFDIGSVTLYGSRDGFIPHYTGMFQTVELQPRHKVSGTEVRKSISDEVKSSSEFRRGAVYAAYNRHPMVYPTVDIAILKYGEKTTDLLLARKESDPEERWRFIGGFVDPIQDSSKEDAARREVGEETGVSIDDLQYVGSTIVDDWRYRDEVDSIFTSLYTATYVYGPARANDDIHTVAWWDLERVNEDIFIQDHRQIYKLLKAHLEKEQGA